MRRLLAILILVTALALAAVSLSTPSTEERSSATSFSARSSAPRTSKSEPPPLPAVPHEPSVRTRAYRYSKGEERIFSLQSETSASVGVAAGGETRGARQIELKVKGALSWITTEVEVDGIIGALSLCDAVAFCDAEGAQGQGARRLDTEPVVFVRLDSQGALLDMRSTDPSTEVELLQSLAWALHWPFPSASSTQRWEIEDGDLNGRRRACIHIIAEQAAGLWLGRERIDAAHSKELKSVFSGFKKAWFDQREGQVTRVEIDERMNGTAEMGTPFDISSHELLLLESTHLGQADASRLERLRRLWRELAARTERKIEGPSKPALDREDFLAPPRALPFILEGFRDATLGGRFTDEAPLLQAELLRRLRLEPTLVQDVLDMLAGPEFDLSETFAIALALAQGDWPGVDETLLALAGRTSASEKQRQLFVEVLGWSPTPSKETCAALGKLASEADAPRRNAALQSLGLIVAQAKSPLSRQTAGAALIRAQPGADSDPCAWLAALGNAALPEALGFIDDALVASDPTIREVAAFALRRYPYRDTADLIERTAKDEQPSVRAALARGLGESESVEAPARLLRILQEDTALEPRLAAIAAILEGTTSLELARAALATAAAAAEPELREFAARVEVDDADEGH